MPNYGFGAQNDNAVHMNTSATSSNASNQAIHMNIGVVAGQETLKNSEQIGTLIIPSGANIGVYSGESMLSMDKGAGHFSNTGLNNGNTALIGHNRGRSNGYFVFVKDLQIGEKLTLEANDITKTYVVSQTHKVHATQTELLMQFGDSRLTLVTCWEGEKDYRRVVIAIESAE